MNDHTNPPPAEPHSPSALATPEPVVVAGDEPRGPGTAQRTVRRPLSEREKQVLRLVCEGLTNLEIARNLGIAAETVKSELKRIFRKIEAKNRTQAAAMIVRQGLV